MSVRGMRSLLFALLFLAPLPAAAQSEAVLRQFFEGKTVAPRFDLPANKAGVDVYPQRAYPLDYAELGKRLKAHGASVRAGQPILVTRVRVKERNIEFHLGGGGYGTLGDDTDTSVYLPLAEKSQREKNLEKELKNETDPAKKKKIREELDALRTQRAREDARSEALASVAEEQKRTGVRLRALDAGSRFNLWYPQGIAAEDLTPEAVMRALAAYVDFSSAIASGAPVASAPTTLRKGLLLEEVEALLGRHDSSSEREQDGLRLLLRTYRGASGRVEATFVEGVLVRYTISSD